jgi:hypothetical protein
MAVTKPSFMMDSSLEEMSYLLSPMFVAVVKSPWK